MLTQLLVLFSLQIWPLQVEECSAPRGESDKLQQAHCTEGAAEARSLYSQIAQREARIASAQREYLLGNYSTSVQHFQLALDMETSEPLAPGAIKALRYWVGMSYLAMNNYQEAEKTFQQLSDDPVGFCSSIECASDEVPSRAESILARARSLERRSHWTDASKVIEKYLHSSHENCGVEVLLDLRLMLGSLYFRTQKTAKSYREFARVLRFYPYSHQAQWIKDHYAAAEILKRYGPQVTSLR